MFLSHGGLELKLSHKGIYAAITFCNCKQCVDFYFDEANLFGIYPKFLALENISHFHFLVETVCGGIQPKPLTPKPKTGIKASEWLKLIGNRKREKENNQRDSIKRFSVHIAQRTPKNMK